MDQPKGYNLCVARAWGQITSFSCCSCLLMLKTAVQAFCGHRFCEACLRASLDRQAELVCTLCREEDDESFTITPDTYQPDWPCRGQMKKMEVFCENRGAGCNWSGKMEHLDAHIAVCPRAGMGNRQQVQHSNDLLRARAHLEITLKGITDLERQFSIEVSDRANMSISEMVQLLQPVMGVSTNDINEYIRLVRALRAYQSRLTNLEAQYSRLSLETSQLEDQLAPRNGVLVWEMEGFRDTFDTRLRVSLVNSPAFYTGQLGYKLRTQIYLNGDGAGAETHISVYVCLLPGRYDGALKWPATLRMRATLFDQSEARNHHVMGLAASFQGPDLVNNVAQGCPRFISLTEFTRRRGDFVKADTMMLEIRFLSQDEPAT